MARWKITSPAIIALLSAVGFLAAVSIYSAVQLEAGKKMGVYQTAEEGLYALAAREYRGVSRVEIGRAERKILGRLSLIKGYIYAAGRADGGEISSRGYETLTCSMVRAKQGWVLVPNGRCPRLVALGQWLLRRS